MASYYLRGKTYWIIYYENGIKRQYSLKTKDKTVAKHKKNEIETRLFVGDSPAHNKKINPHSLLKEYDSESSTRKTPSSIKNDHTRIENFLNWSKIQDLNKATPSLVDQYFQEKMSKEVLTKKGKVSKRQFSKITANHYIESLKTFLNFAVRKKYIFRNPLVDMKKIKFNKLPPRFLNKEEIEKVIEAAKQENIYPLIMTAVYTGMRLGELRRLKWEDIDLRKKTITTLVTKGKRFRVIPIHKDLEPFLKEGNIPFNTVNLRRVFLRIRRKTKIQDLVWKTFRHSFASHLVMSGVELYTVSKLLGHKDVSTTQIYSHLTPGHLQESVRKLKF